MTMLARLAELAEKGPGEYTVSKAVEIMSRIILPKKITGKTIDKYIRKALRVGAWKGLKPENKALLILTRRLGLIKSRTLKSILNKLFLEIELYTLRGKALFYGIIMAMKTHIHKLQELLNNTKRLLTLGIFYLNNPPMYRIYG